MPIGRAGNGGRRTGRPRSQPIESRFRRRAPAQAARAKRSGSRGLVACCLVASERDQVSDRSRMLGSLAAAATKNKDRAGREASHKCSAAPRGWLWWAVGARPRIERWVLCRRTPVRPWVCAGSTRCRACARRLGLTGRIRARRPGVGGFGPQGRPVRPSEERCGRCAGGGVAQEVASRAMGRRAGQRPESAHAPAVLRSGLGTNTDLCAPVFDDFISSHDLETLETRT